MQGLRVGRVLFSYGLEIEHDLPEYPAPLIFWTIKPDRIISVLNELGYPVVEAKLSIGI